MHDKLYISCLLIVGLINLLPVIGLFGKAKLESTYQIKITSDALVLLMQHRALLFGLIGGYVIYSVWNTSYQTPALVLAAVSMIGFVVLMQLSNVDNPALMKVLYVDYIGIFALIVATLLKSNTYNVG